MSLGMKIRDWVVRTVGGVHPDVGYKLLTEWIAETAGDNIPTSAEKILKNYRSWIYVCASKNATALASVPLRLYAGKANKSDRLYRPTKGVERERAIELRGRASLFKALAGAEAIEEITEHPLLDMLTQVNEWLNGFDAMELTQTYLEMVGVAYWRIRRNGLATPEAFEVLPAQKIAVKRDRAGQPIEYLYGDAPQQERYSPAEIVHFAMVSPLTRLMGYGPGHAAFGAAARQASIEKIEDALFENRAMPATVLVPKQPLTEAQSTQLVDSWNLRMKGVAKSGGVTVAPIPMEILKLAISAEELTKLADPRVVKEEIAAVFGVPLSKLELSKSDASAVQGDITYLRDTILPRLRRLEGKLNERLVPMYAERPGVKLILAFDNPLQADRQYELQRAQSMATTHGVILINEAREAFGLDPLEEVNGEFIIKPAGTFTNVPELPGVRGAIRAQTVFKTDTVDRKLRTVLRRIFHEQRDEVLSRLKAKHAKGTASEPFDRGAWNDRIAIDARPFIERDLGLGAEQGATALPGGLAWDIRSPQVEEFIRNYVYRFANEINKTTISELRDVFTVAEQEGMTVSEIADGVEGVFDNAERYRSMMIARTERSRAVSAGEDAIWKESGVVRGVRWLANPNACEFCKAIEQKYGGANFAPLGGMFAELGQTINGTEGGTMRLTYSDTPYPPLHPNCACSRLAVLEEG